MAADHIGGVLLLGLDHDGVDGVADLDDARRGRQDALRHEVLPRRVEGLHLGRHLIVDLGHRHPGHLGAEPAVEKERAIDHHRHREVTQPLAVDAVGFQRLRVFDPAEGVFDHPGLHGGVIGGFPGETPVALDRRPELLALLLGFAVDKGRVDLGVGVAVEPGEIHGLVVAEDALHPTARGLGLGLEADEEIEGLTDMEPAIEEIAELDIGRVATGPLQVLVDDPGFLQDRGQAFEVAVDIADCDDSTRMGGRRRQRHRQRERQDEICDG